MPRPTNIRRQKKQTEADYKMAKAECKKLSRPEKKACMKKVEADHELAEEALKWGKQCIRATIMPPQSRFLRRQFGFDCPLR